MKKLLLLFLLFSYGASGQSLHIDSTRFITGLRCCTGINYTIPTVDKGFLFVGVESENPRGIIPYFPLDTSGAGNVMVGKIDSNQQISWIKIYGGSENEGAGSACQLPDGGYAVLCTTSSDNGDVTNFHGENDYWLLRLDDSGNLLWENCYGGPGGEQAASVALTPDGGFIMLGTTNQAGGEVTLHYGDEFDYDWWVVKTDSLGNLQWQKTLGGTGQESGYGTILSIDSAYYLISSSGSTDHNCTDTFWHPAVSTGYDYYVLKLDTGGNVLWDSSYGGSNDEDEAYAMFDTRDSCIVITGITLSDNYMVTEYVGDGDMWVIKINKNGTLLWQKTLGNTAQETTGTGICAAPDGGYIAYGNMYNDTSGIEGLWLFNLDSAGNEIANKRFGGPANIGVVEVSYSIIPYLNGYVAAGLSGADTFTEGTTYGDFDGGGGPFISYIGYWPLAVKNIYTQSEQIQIYPNPATEYTTILVPDNGGNIQALNCIGENFFVKKVNQNTRYININTESWAKGLYIVKWQGEDGVVLTKKLIIN